MLQGQLDALEQRMLSKMDKALARFLQALICSGQTKPTTLQQVAKSDKLTPSGGLNPPPA